MKPDWDRIDVLQEALRKAMSIIIADKALLRQALEALEDVPYMSNGDDQITWSEAVYALRKRLGEEEV